MLTAQVRKIRKTNFCAETGAFLLEKLEVEMMFVMKKPAGVYSNLGKKIPMASFCANEDFICHQQCLLICLNDFYKILKAN